MEKELSEEILEKIKRERLKPKSKRHFMLWESAVWLSFVASIVLGAVSFSVILHFWEINDWDAYYRLSENILTFAFLTTPYFWLFCLTLFTFAAYLYLRRTRRGYRWEHTKMVAWNLGLSLLFGSVIYSVGAARQVEKEFAARAPFYKEIRDRQEAVWLRPERGVIVGRVTYIAQGGNVLRLDDPRQVTWLVDTSGAQYFQGFIVQEGFTIKVFGKEGRGGNLFIAEEVRPLIRERGWRR